jgi:hypothetical protein
MKEAIAAQLSLAGSTARKLKRAGAAAAGGASKDGRSSVGSGGTPSGRSRPAALLEVRTRIR